jgi:hypothetical protein
LLTRGLYRDRNSKVSISGFNLLEIDSGVQSLLDSVDEALRGTASLASDQAERTGRSVKVDKEGALA